MRRIAARETEVTSFVTTDYVLDEAVTLTRFAHSHRKAVELAEATLSSKFVRLVYCDEGLFSDGMGVFKTHSEKEWSLTGLRLLRCYEETRREDRLHIRCPLQAGWIRDDSLGRTGNSPVEACHQGCEQSG